MPLYSYVCDECMIEADVFMPVAERDDIVCDCGTSVRRVLTAPHLHGSPNMPND